MAETGTTPGGRGRFPGFDVLGQTPTWDDATKAQVLQRLQPVPVLRFFTIEEEATARALLDRLLAQDRAPKIPVLELIDARLADGQGDGWRHEDMPEDGEAFHRSIAALDARARERFGAAFHSLEREEQTELIEWLRGEGPVDGMPSKWLWNLWMRYACAAFYSHPWSWNEIGFGGPAYPRGYKNLGVGALEPWEEREHAPHDPVKWADRVERARAE